jgi:signal transduction histidine kinase
MANRKKHTRARGSSDSRALKDFLILSQQILLYANRGRPSVEFLIDISGTLVSFFRCRALELWLKDEGTCTRWEATRSPKRFSRLSNISSDVVDPMIQQGVVWTNDTQKEEAFGSVSKDRSLAHFPLAYDEVTVGLILLKSERPNFFKETEIELYQHLARTVAIAVVLQKVHLAQRERVKELTCLYDVAHMAAQTHSGLHDILQEIVRRLPSAWQYPEITEARIVFDVRTYSTEEFTEGRHQQKAEIVVDGKRRGIVEIVYKEDKPELDEGPFLVEERRLIDAVAQEVAFVIQRKRAEAEGVKLQEQIRHADRLATIGQLAAGVAHELNEPLGEILGFAQLAKKHPDLPSQVSQDLSKIEAATLYAREVIQKLVLFARQTSPSKKKVNINHIVEEGLYFLEARCTKAGIKLTRILQPDLPEITADPTQLHQVLVNLVVNAVQAMPGGGNLTVETTYRGGYVSMVVADTGSGMSEEVKERIFEPFFTTKDVAEGTGLGLPIVQGIVTSHGGQLEVHSQPGCGSRFAIHLPINGPADTIQGE